MKCVIAFRVTSICFVLQCLQIVSAAPESGCGYSEFRCANGSCIEDLKMCDGIKHCADGSDESFLTCHNFDCEDKYRCSYGGCIPNSKFCDEKKDCWDGSDETILECSTDEELNDYFARLNGNCSRNENFQCRKYDQCIPHSKTCDGKKDCIDGSDETSELCMRTFCPEYAFRCEYGGCVLGGAMCNHVEDCVDGTDELAPICLKGDEGTWDISPPKTPHMKICTVSDATEGLIVLNTINNEICSNGATLEHNSHLSYTCAAGYRLIGKKRNLCFNGKWTNSWPECVRMCERSVIQRDLSRDASCVYKGSPIDCKHLLVDTEVHLQCATGYKPAYSTIASGKITCGSSGNWTTLTKPLRCVEKCGEISKDQASRGENPWTVSIFQRGRYNEPTFKFRCLGTIVSQSVVVTTGNCFGNDEFDRDHTTYTMAEGNHEEEFWQNEEHGYNLHNISQITLPDYINKKDGIRVLLAILIVVKPFQLSATVRPICLKHTSAPSLGVQYWESGATKLGQSWTHTKLEIKYLTNISSNFTTRSSYVTQVYPFYNHIKNVMRKYQKQPFEIQVSA